MLIDVSILSADEFFPQDFSDGNIPDKYIYGADDEILFTATVFKSEETVTQLIRFLFQETEPIKKVYRDGNVRVLDLSGHRESLIDFDYLENNYSKWLLETGRENSMNEYGMLMDFVGHARRGIDKKYLIMVVANR